MLDHAGAGGDPLRPRDGCTHTGGGGAVHDRRPSTDIDSAAGDGDAMKPTRALLGGAGGGIATPPWLQPPASAHYPDVVAENVCADGVPAVGVTATAWQSFLGEDHRINSDVRIDAWGPHTTQSV